MNTLGRVFMQSFRYEPELDSSGNPLRDELGNIVLKSEPDQVNPEVGNALIAPGRQYVGYLITGLASGGFLFVAAGSSTVAVDTLLDDRLGGYVGSSTPAFEYNLGTSRKLLQSTAYGGNLTTADWTQETYTDGLGNVYRYKCQATVTYGPGDPNGTPSGVPLQRYGLCLSSFLPATVTGISGIMLNEMIDTAPQNLTDSNAVQVKFILRI